MATRERFPVAERRVEMASDEEFPNDGSTAWIPKRMAKRIDALLEATFGPEWRKVMSRSAFVQQAVNNHLPEPRHVGTNGLD